LAHIIRVTRLLVRWAEAMALDARAVAAWRDAGAWHDALRDAAPDDLGPPSVDPTLPPGAWHGPAAAKRLRKDGEERRDVLDAITWHTVGNAKWASTGRALFCADFLEPGRRSQRDKRRDLAARFPDDPTGVLRKVVRMRLDKAERGGTKAHPRLAALWEAVR
jgi:2-amino-4-hydroxy-6-hydroxymethyldihydropteridine diphosphokinase